MRELFKKQTDLLKSMVNSRVSCYLTFHRYQSALNLLTIFSSRCSIQNILLVFFLLLRALLPTAIFCVISISHIFQCWGDLGLSTCSLSLHYLYLSSLTQSIALNAISMLKIPKSVSLRLICLLILAYICNCLLDISIQITIRHSNFTWSSRGIVHPLLPAQRNQTNKQQNKINKQPVKIYTSPKVFPITNTGYTTLPVAYVKTLYANLDSSLPFILNFSGKTNCCVQNIYTSSPFEGQATLISLVNY